MIRRPTFQDKALKKKLSDKLLEAVEMYELHGDRAVVMIYMRNTMRDVAKELVDNRL